MKGQNLLACAFQADPKSGSMKCHHGISEQFCDKKVIKLPNSYSKFSIKITSRNGFTSPNSSILILTNFVIFEKSKNRNDKFSFSISFSINDIEQGGQKFPACQFSARSEVRIDEKAFWRFRSFLWYLKKIIKFLTLDSRSTIKITPRNTNFVILDPVSNFDDPTWPVASYGLRKPTPTSI